MITKGSFPLTTCFRYAFSEKAAGPFVAAVVVSLSDSTASSKAWRRAPTASAIDVLMCHLIFHMAWWRVDDTTTWEALRFMEHVFVIYCTSTSYAMVYPTGGRYLLRDV